MPPIGDYVREALSLLTVTGGPMLAALAAVGLIVGILQAATQVNDPALGFLPRALALGGFLVGFGGWLANSYAEFLVKTAARIAASAP